MKILADRQTKNGRKREDIICMSANGKGWPLVKIAKAFQPHMYQHFWTIYIDIIQ